MSTEHNIKIERNRTMTRKFDDFLQEQLQDPEIRKECEALQPEHTVIQAMIDARKKSGMTQKELAEITGIAQGELVNWNVVVPIHLLGLFSAWQKEWE